MKKIISILLVVGLLSFVGTLFADNGEKEKMAIETAQTWLSLIDDGRYEASWEEAASFFKEKVTKDSWVEAMQGIRAPLGKVTSREVGRRDYATSLPGAPEGEYVVIQFNTDFENRKFIIERVTPMLDKDGQWRVSGYYVL